MKLIIDIPNSLYANLAKIRNGSIANKRILDSVKNGTPLDDVKAEIEKQIERDFAFSETETLKVPYHYGTAGGLQVAVRILNNIGKAESEDKE